MIKSIKWKNARILKDLVLDFFKGTNDCYKTIIFVGENGTGKTTILSSIYKVLDKYQLSSGINEIIYKTDEHLVTQYRNEDGKEEIVNETGEHYSVNILPLSPFQKNKKLFLPGKDGVCFTSAKTGFQNLSLNDSNSNKLDEKAISNDAHFQLQNLTNLFVELKHQDDTYIADKFRNNEQIDSNREEIEASLNLTRFSTSFSTFFKGELEYDDTNEKDGCVYFKKGDTKIRLQELSSGEQQIVFRGTYLLRDIKKTLNGTALIDEPEVSLHPRWQKEILAYYQNLFKVNGEQKSQIFIATHSPFIIEAALKDKDNTLIIVLKNNNGKVSAINLDQSNFVLPTPTLAEINYEAFNIASKDYHNELYSYLQDLTKSESVGKTDKFILELPIITEALKCETPHPTNMRIKYHTLPTKIRNHIDHPNNGNDFNDEELMLSTEFLRDICRKQKNLSNLMIAEK